MFTDYGLCALFLTTCWRAYTAYESQTNGVQAMIESGGNMLYGERDDCGSVISRIVQVVEVFNASMVSPYSQVNIPICQVYHRHSKFSIVGGTPGFNPNKDSQFGSIRRVGPQTKIIFASTNFLRSSSLDIFTPNSLYLLVVILSSFPGPQGTRNMMQ